MTHALLMAITLLLQRALGAPGGPQWAGLVLLPVAWIVGAALTTGGRRWVWIALVIGLGWDVLLEPVVGPGGIAWSAAALSVLRLAAIVADRSSKSWFAFGAVGAGVVLVIQRLALFPLGMNPGWNWTDLGLCMVGTAVWCWSVGFILQLDLPARWQAWRARKLR